MQVNHLTLVHLAIIVDVAHGYIGDTVLVDVDDGDTLTVDVQLLNSDGVAVGQIHITKTYNADIKVVALNGLHAGGLQIGLLRLRGYCYSYIRFFMTYLWGYVLGKLILVVVRHGLPLLSGIGIIKIAMPAEYTARAHFCTSRLKGFAETLLVLRLQCGCRLLLFVTCCISIHGLSGIH